MFDYTSRLHRVQAALPPHQFLLISNPYDLRYLVGFITLTPFERECFLLLSNTQAILALSSFSSNETLPQVQQVYINSTYSLGQFVQEHIEEKNDVVSLDLTTLTAREFEHIKEYLQPSQYSTTLAPNLKIVRMIKDHQEIDALRKANTKTHQALHKTLKNLKTGMTEQEVQEMFETAIEKKKCEPFAFPTIVAFGEHTALPHHQPTPRKLRDNEPVLIDCGATHEGYCADVTRTVWFGKKPSEDFLQIENIIKDAYKKTMQHCDNEAMQQKSVTAKELDSICRTYIASKGYGNEFIHTTGHGVGLYIHESPSLSSRDQTLLQPNMVITIEPGIYIDGKFGYRYENSILFTENGYEELGVIK